MCYMCEIAKDAPNESAARLGANLDNFELSYTPITKTYDASGDELAYTAYVNPATEKPEVVMACENRVIQVQLVMTLTPEQARQAAAQLLNKADEAEDLG